MVTVVFHWGISPEHTREFQDTLDEAMNWFKSQPGFLMGVAGRDTYNHSEMLSCLEWQSKEEADQAYAQWQRTPWFERLQSFLTRPVSFVTHDTIGTFVPKGTSLPWAKETARSGAASSTRRTTKDIGTREAMARPARAQKGESKAKTKTTEPRAAKSAVEPGPKLRERATGAESRARTGPRKPAR